ncbi:hypothetical protein E5082_05325 [Streptomyces griseoluteus]|uniref:Uncharacterized protein n=1 Tax=Streptomyces griseoluteus TaxID=29306 RepID=A0A4Z1DQX5_STRGP|nr:hypothetical protein [Streptomyces griseoluteus]TGN87804.1 hypothetical protein E5082_05325 [Streptomyces griseoluteus]GHF24338.1 hypothetical protein GCM10017776_48530 [Streptomyces griseoluteus]
MSRYSLRAVGAALVVVLCAGCGGNEKPHGEAALKSACEGVFDDGLINEARKSDDFNDLHVASGTRSHAAAVKTMLDEDHAAYACILDDKDSSDSDAGALSIKFTPGMRTLFPEDQNRSYGAYKAYKLGNGMQATIEAGGADVYFECESKDRMRPLTVTGTFHNDFDLSSEARFRPLFRSSLKVAKLLKCENNIKFPDPATMKYLPLQKD